ncbi:MAG: putative Mevalonate kinase [Promethearchaeota archaeon]|nr:MAG: putative Mevalonate kinase [Candidatus Lokiarchaeota archaeon]
MKHVKSAAPGKTILFGEHSVVYGFPAIAMAINIQTKCELQEIQKDIIELRFKNYGLSLNSSSLSKLITSFPESFKQYGLCFKMLHEKYGIEFNKLRVTLSSDLFPGSGLGSSASTAVSLISAINNFYDLNLLKEDISKLAYKMEEIVHGSPSGIDNTICTFGNIIMYKQGNFEFLESFSDLQILISYTNIEHDTKNAINSIKKLKKKRPGLVSKYLKEMGEIANSAKMELIDGNLVSLGDLMNRNQQLLSLLGVSNKKIDLINKIALQNGAYGSKLTGAGLGGCVISLGERKALQKISIILNEKNIPNFLTTRNETGVHLIE